MIGRGYKRTLVFSEENGFGNLVDADTFIPIQVPFFSCTISETRNLEKSEIIRGSRHRNKPINSDTVVDGDVVVPLDYNYLGLWLGKAIGRGMVTGTTAPYSHMFTPRDEITSFALEHGLEEPPYYGLFKGLKINSIGLDLGDQQEVKLNFGIMGKEEILSGNKNLVTPAQSKYAFKQFYGYQATIQENGLPIATVTKCSINITNNIDELRSIGNMGKCADLIEGFVDVTGTITALFDSQVLWMKAKEGMKSSLEIFFDAGDNTHSLKISIPELLFKQGQKLDGQAGLLVEFPFEAYYENNLLNSSIVFQLKNNIDNYGNEDNMN